VNESLPTSAVLRVGRVTFDPSLYDAVIVADKRTSEYLIPAIEQLPGLIRWFSGVSREGSLSQVSVWDSEEHAAQLDHLEEMRTTARKDFAAVGVMFTAETATYNNYPITWNI
jgi:hypothetical protein